jgi:hypothetical protein
MSWVGCRARALARLVVALCVLVAVLVVGSHALGAWDALRTEEVQHQVWSAYFNETVARTLLETPPAQLLMPPRRLMFVIRNHTQPISPRLPALVCHTKSLFRPQLPLSRLPSLQTSTYAGFLLTNLASHPVRPELALTAPYRLADAASIGTYGRDKARWEALFGDSIGYYVLSAVGLNRDRTQALVHVDFVCGLCGQGKYVLLQRTGTGWEVVSETLTWIS